MNRKRVIRISIVVLSALFVILLFYFTIPRVGYCFDTAFDETGERLYVTAGNRGLHVFSVSPQGKLTHLTTYFAGGYYRYLEVAGDYAYIANSGEGLEILDIREHVPRPLWTQTGSKGYGLHIAGHTAYLASNEYGLQILDISNPTSPVLVGTLPTTGRAWDVWVNGADAFIADRDLGLVVADVSTPSQPQQIGALAWSEEPMAEVLDGTGECVYIAAGVDGLIVVDVSDPRKPTSTFRYDPGLDSYGEGVVVEGETLYLSMSDSPSSEQNGLHIFDLRQPCSPRLMSTYSLADGLEDVAVAGPRLAVANRMSGVVLFGVQAPDTPILDDVYPGRFWRLLLRYLR
jgi:hypothetical protein